MNYLPAFSINRTIKKTYQTYFPICSKRILKRITINVYYLNTYVANAPKIIEIKNINIVHVQALFEET